MSMPESARQEYRKPPLTIAGRSPFDGIRFRWGGAGDLLLGISLIGAIHNGGAIVFGVLFIMLGIATWVLTGFGKTPWYAMSTPGQVIAGTGSVIGLLFVYTVFFYFFILRWFWRYVIAPGLR